MFSTMRMVIVAAGLVGSVVVAAAQSGTPQRIDLAERLGAGGLRVVNRDATRLQDKSDGI